MKRVIASVLAVSAFAAAAPALSQIVVDKNPPPLYYDDDGYVAKDAYPYSDDRAYRGYSSWRGLDARQADLDRRIDIGVDNGSLTRAEAARLRDEFRDLAYTEARYRRTGGGLTDWERADLDRRFDRLSARIDDQRHDNQYRGYHYNRY